MREPREQRLSVLCALRELAEAIGPFVYGGDVIVGNDGSMVVIDENDWPSFAVLRDVAGEKIARARQAGDEAMSATEPVVSGMAATPGVGATYKAREVEETLDVWFYRPLGHQIARAAWRLGLAPNAVTAMGGLLGILAGHLFLYRGWVPAA